MLLLDAVQKLESLELRRIAYPGLVGYVCRDIKEPLKLVLIRPHSEETRFCPTTVEIVRPDWYPYREVYDWATALAKLVDDRRVSNVRWGTMNRFLAVQDGVIETYYYDEVRGLGIAEAPEDSWQPRVIDFGESVWFDFVEAGIDTEEEKE